MWTMWEDMRGFDLAYIQFRGQIFSPIIPFPSYKQARSQVGSQGAEEPPF